MAAEIWGLAGDRGAVLLLRRGGGDALGSRIWPTDAVYGGDREREDPAPLKYPLLPVCGAPGSPSVVPLHFLPIVRSAYQRGIVLPPRLSACPNYTCSPGAFQQETIGARSSVNSPPTHLLLIGRKRASYKHKACTVSSSALRRGDIVGCLSHVM